MKNEPSANDEIDLMLIFSKIRQLFIGLGNFISDSFYVARKRWVLLLIFSLVGGGMGTGLFFITRPVYSSTLILSSITLRNDYCSDIVNNLQLIIKDNSSALLAHELKISVASAAAVKSLEFDNYDESVKKIYKDKDTVVLGRPFRVIAEAFNNTVFDTLQKALVSYMENNEYALKRKAIKTENIKLMKEKIGQQLDQLDSLKFVVTSNLVPRGNQSGFVFGQPIDPINVYKEEIELFRDDLELKRDLTLIDNIQVIQDFLPRDKPDSPKLFKNIVICGLLTFLIGLFYAMNLERKRGK